MSMALMPVANTESQPPPAILLPPIEVQFVACDCCGLTEECTPAYIEGVRAVNCGKWICGLCGEAIKDEIMRSEQVVDPEEAMTRHMNFCMKFKSSGPPPDPTVQLISAMRQILRRCLESKSAPSTPTRKTKKNHPGAPLARSESCFPSLIGNLGLE